MRLRYGKRGGIVGVRMLQVLEAYKKTINTCGFYLLVRRDSPRPQFSFVEVFCCTRAERLLRAQSKNINSC